MFRPPSSPTRNEAKDFTFDTEDFHIFGRQGVIGKTYSRNGTIRTTLSTKHRPKDPNIGDLVGIMTNCLLKAFSIKGIGVVVGIGGTKSKPTYDVWIVEAETMGWEIGFLGFGAKKLDDPLALGLHTGIEGAYVVEVLEDSVAKYPGFDLVKAQKAEIDAATNKLAEERKELRKRKREEAKARKESKKGKKEK